MAPSSSHSTDPQLDPSAAKPDNRKKSTSTSTPTQPAQSINNSSSFLSRLTGVSSSSSASPGSSFSLRNKSKSPPLKSMTADPPSWFNGTFTVGVSEDANLQCRSSMEDTHMIVYDFGSPLNSVASGGSSSNGSASSKLRSKEHSSHTQESIKASSSVYTSRNVGNHISQDAGYFAVFDGHAGKGVADWCGQKLHLLLEEHLKKDPNIPVPELLDHTFTEADAILGAKQSIKNAGCTAVVAVLRWEDRVYDSHDNVSKSDGSTPVTALKSNKSEMSAQNLYRHYHFLHHHRISDSVDEVRATGVGSSSSLLPRQTSVRERMLYTANAGDARIVLCRKGKAYRLSYDHKGTDSMEAQRIANSGGLVLNGRVNGILAVTRALGDTYIKKLVTSHPYTTETYVTEDDEFIILACDGLWDVTTDQQAVDLIRTIKNPQEASKKLIEYALSHFSMDNLTCMVVRFDSKMGEMIKQAHTRNTPDLNLTHALSKDEQTAPESELKDLAIK
ncbi:phosphatase 2C-like domain-containing protein [Lipomyces arxii]|uniref:phosphatase 2C-like domain-containing protein n=1 Tax=Lipomyces arxii TaxID=56418 RepID=UPI0034CDB878